jgi:hypothetical protein
MPTSVCAPASAATKKSATSIERMSGFLISLS